MRKSRRIQLPLTENWLDLEHAKELQAISRLLDQHPRLTELVLQDLLGASGRPKAETGAQGMSAEQVLRTLVIKQMNGFSYQELIFHLADSRTYQTFCRFGVCDKLPSKSTVHANLKAVRAETLESIHHQVVAIALGCRMETGKKVRVDCTVVEANIHTPSDSELLWDCVRVITRLMGRARKLLGPEEVNFADRTRRAKRRRREIRNAKSNKARRRPYRDLLKVTQEVHATATRICTQLQDCRSPDSLHTAMVHATGRDLGHFLRLSAQVIDQTRRRVLLGESVPAGEKIVSIFEEHTDIVRKDRRETLYGHKICLAGGASSMILDCQILEGNPADSTLAETMLDRQIEVFDKPPRQMAFDGAFASKANLKSLKDKGVRDVMFSKSKGLAVSDMVKSTWVYQKLWRFRAGIEGNISFLKRSFGLGRCTWRSLPSFKSYVWASILSFNLLLIARHTLA